MSPQEEPSWTYKQSDMFALVTGSTAGIGPDRRSTQLLEKRKTSPIIFQNPEQL